VKAETKNTLRKRIQELLINQKEEQRIQKSRVVKDRLFAIPEFKSSQTIMFYASFQGEVDTFEMMKQAKTLNKKLILPVIIKENKSIQPVYVDDLENGLTEGSYGIREPRKTPINIARLDEIDLVIVPGIAFDRSNNRLGRGVGYYDRFLRELSPEVPTVGLAFDFQIVDRLPITKEHDVPVSRVIYN
jgi:5-formyltetrahydrofolate cyclo-ligase